MHIMSQYYQVEITKHDDPASAASFIIRPPVEFLANSSKNELEVVIRRMIISRMNTSEAESLELAITHNLPDNSATVGRAYFRGLQLATGAVVLQQALEYGLNGSNNFVSPASPLFD
jgi:hypothetical protein